ncbi:MAG: 2-oxoglutarate dehydrogenase, E2 component, dihydrolipoamide succinyltransferase [Nocardioidaceae bacterium]|nr:2-oxoglutarate dehydrogenase, E2 component, dihydrolipoamide succinyltransferase [Nocardioidaceae bacterium]
MTTEVKLPALGESVTEGTVTQWLKSVGDEVAVDEALLEVSTDKVDTEIPSPVAGTLLEIKANEDDTVEVGGLLAVIGDSDESGGAAAGGTSSDDAAKPQAQPTDGDGEEPAQAAQTETAEQPEAEAPADQPEQEEQEQDSDGQTQAEQPTETPGQEAQTDEGASAATPSEQTPASQADTGGSDGESTEVKLPALGESVTEGTVTQWLKSVGDDVAVDEALLEVSTDKVDTEIPSPVAGKLLEISVSEDETVEVGAVLALIGTAGEAPAEQESPPPAGDATDEDTSAAAEEPAQEQDTGGERPAEEAAAPQPGPTEEQSAGAPAPAATGGDQTTGGGETTGDGDSKSYVTPLVRKLAAQHSVELSKLTGTGVGGRIRKQDVLEAAEKAKQSAAPAAEEPPGDAAARTGAPVAPSPLRGKTEKLSRIRKVIAARMVESLQVSAQLTTVVEVDVTAISRLRNRVKANFEQREGVKLSFLPFFAKATIDALKAYPQVNASIDTEAGTVTYHDGEHLSIAVDTEKGLMVPVIKDAGDLSIAGLARKIADLAARTRESKIGPDELTGGTFTLTNTGSRGALFDTPILNQPQVGMLGTGSVVKRPVVISDNNIGETIAIRQMVYLALTYDHRLVDGADAARFLTTVKQRLEEANFESELGL